MEHPMFKLLSKGTSAPLKQDKPKTFNRYCLAFSLAITIWVA